MSTSGITFAGIGSGIDTESIISRLIQVESIPIQRLQSQQAQLTNRMGLMSQLRGSMANLQSAANAVNSATAFQNVTATSSDTSVATIASTNGAAQGIYALEVSKLAQSHKVSSTAQADATTALALSGSFVVNGKAVTVNSTDTLTGIAQKINEANAGVTASIINGGAGNTYLTISANSSGATNKVQVADLSGTVASTLGMVAGVGAIRETITNGATSYGFSSSSTAVGTLMNATGLGPTTITINSVNVSVDLSTQSLQDVANAINAAGTGATASVRSVTSGSTTTYKLDIAGASTPTFDDPDKTLGALGILQSGFSHELIEAQDAEYSLDGVDFTSSTNTISSVITGVTLTLLKADETTPKTSTLTLNQDNDAVKDKIKEFMNAYNGIVDFIKSNSQFNKDTFEAGPLFGDAVARQVEQVLSDNVFTNVTGLSTEYTNLTQLGFGFDKDGRLKMDEATLDAALANSPSSVGNLFHVRGDSTGSALQYVSSSDKTKASGTGVYSVVVSQIATKGSYQAETAQSAASTVTETLTFNGTLFGSTAYNLVLPSGSDLTATINTINNDTKLKDLLIASNDGGKLLLTTKKYGTNGNFTVVSNLAAAVDNSGVGTSSAGIAVTGVNVAGTINGEAATGSGQFLTGDSGNLTTDGLQVQYTGNTLGVAGDIRVTKGIGSVISSVISQYTDTVTGLLTSNDKALQDQFTSLGESITSLQARLTLKEEDLRRKFGAMEQAISQMQTQGQQLGAITSSLGKKK